MALPNETIHLGANPHCPDCGKLLLNEVLQSGAGYYIGTRCCCGPYSRESHYYQTREAAQFDLDHDSINYRNTGYHGNS